MPFPPIQLPRLREELCAFWRSEHARSCLDRTLGEIRATRLEHVDLTTTQLASEELSGLEAAELFWVNDDMTTLAITAADTLPDFHLAPHDLPAAHGIVIFHTAIRQTDVKREDGGHERNWVIGANWTSTEHGVWVTWLCHRDWWTDYLIDDGYIDHRQAEHARRDVPAARLHNRVWWTYGQDGSEAIDSYLAHDHPDNLTPDARRTCERVLKSIWLLMAQPLTETAPVALPRNMRRAAERKTGRVPQVRTIQLRKRAASGASNDSRGRDWHHQWIVRGHWRQQWYPAREVHRPKWIAPHVKGPDDKPLLGSQKVHTLTGLPFNSPRIFKRTPIAGANTPPEITHSHQKAHQGQEPATLD